MTRVPLDGEAWLELASQRLRGAGLKSGAARTAVIELLAKEGGCLLSAQEIALGLGTKGPGSNASVYRTLERLTELGLVHRLDGTDGVARYEVAHPDHHHHHFFDETTGEVVAFEDEGLETAIATVAERLGVELTSHDVILRGTSI